MFRMVPPGLEYLGVHLFLMDLQALRFLVVRLFPKALLSHSDPMFH